MGSNPDALAVTASGPLTAGWFDSKVNPFFPTKPVKVAPHVRESVEIQPITSGGGLSSTNDAFEVPKLGNFLCRLYFLISWASLSAATAGTGTFFRPMDGIGIYCIKQIRIIYSQNKLQTIRPDDLLLMHNKWYPDEQRVILDDMVKLNMTPQQRDLLKAKAFVTKLPLHNFISQQDLTQAMAPHGLSQKIRVEFDYETPQKCFQADGIPGGTLPSSDAAYWTSHVLVAEYEHTEAQHRANMVRLYSSRAGVRYLVNDFVYANGGSIAVGAAATSLGGAAITVSNITGLNNPIHSLCFVFRWYTDTRRTLSLTAGPSDAFGRITGGVGGRDMTNFNGWLQPALTPVTANVPEPALEFLEMVSGNTSIVKKERVLHMIGDVASRFYKGTAGIGIPIAPYGKDLIVVLLMWCRVRPNARECKYGLSGFQSNRRTATQCLHIQYTQWLHHPGCLCHCRYWHHRLPGPDPDRHWLQRHRRDGMSIFVCLPSCISGLRHVQRSSWVISETC